MSEAANLPFQYSCTELSNIQFFPVSLNGKSTLFVCDFLKVTFFQKLQSRCFVKKVFLNTCFPVKFAIFLRTRILKNISVASVASNIKRI